ncbi:MAG: hypothetical protein JRF72_21505 [Deltaproteobacteria bacterium]|jgi:hypothetical protein|nr:hypothetical protein [Deltaproteobacteria bacterium]
MSLRKLIIAVIVMLMTHTHPAVFAEDEDISDEDQEIIEVLEILEVLDLLEEDIEILQNLDEIGDDDED